LSPRRHKGIYSENKNQNRDRGGKRELKAILSVTVKDENGDNREKSLLFDTETATEVCNVINAFGYAVQTIFLSPAGWLFLRDNPEGKLKLANQKQTKDYIGENYPERHKWAYQKKPRKRLLQQLMKYSEK
jgi:hypothetical protein